VVAAGASHEVRGRKREEGERESARESARDKGERGAGRSYRDGGRNFAVCLDPGHTADSLPCAPGQAHGKIHLFQLNHFHNVFNKI